MLLKLTYLWCTSTFSLAFVFSGRPLFMSCFFFGSSVSRDVPEVRALEIQTCWNCNFLADSAGVLYNPYMGIRSSLPLGVFWRSLHLVSGAAPLLC